MGEVTAVVARAGSADPAAPLVVLLHGRGADERSIIALADHLPDRFRYAAVRAPIAEGGGYAWFANRGIGRPVAESLRVTMDWFRGWLDATAGPGVPVVLIGFSGGAAFAGGLLLDDPGRYAGGAVLYGTLPFEAGVPTTRGHLRRLPIFLAHGDQDTVIPRELQARTWSYLHEESGAALTARRDPVGHGIAAPALAALGGWLREIGVVTAAASALRELRTKTITGTPFTAADATLTADWGYRVQESDLAARLAGGERRTGAKLGLTSAAKQATMGVHEPVAGFLTDALADLDGILDRTAQPRIEPEIAFRLARPLDGPLTEESAAAAIDGVCAAFEVIDSRFAGFAFRLPDVVADNTSAAGYRLGAWSDPATLPDLATLTCTFSADGEVLHTADGAAVLGHPLRALVHLAAHLAARGDSLPAGSVVLAGALTDAVPLRAGVRYRVEIDGLRPVELTV